jgi:hypothetical protein
MECCRFYGKKAIPAFHYIAVTAQGSPGTANMYRMRCLQNK